jgi:tetratricopeptide (TPR) repeat protein
MRRIGQLLLDAGDSEAALQWLIRASQLRPDDIPTVLFIADAHITGQRFQEAQDMLETSMEAFRQRRSPELAMLRQRMAKLADAAGDQEARLEWLNAAMDADMNNGVALADLAILAQELGAFDIALKALRGITLLKTDCPMSRAEAFYRQAVIVAQKGERKRAVLWAKKAKAEDASLPGVDELLESLGQTG